MVVSLALVCLWALWLLMFMDRSYLRWCVLWLLAGPAETTRLRWRHAFRYHNRSDHNIDETRRYTPRRWATMWAPQRVLWATLVFAVASLYLPVSTSARLVVREHRLGAHNTHGRC